MYKYDASVRIYAPSKKPQDGNDYIAYSYNSTETNLSFNVVKTNEEKPAQCICEISGVDVNTYHEISSSTMANGVQTKYIEIFFNSRFGSEMLFTGLINEVSYKFGSGQQTMTILFDEGMIKFNNAKRSISTVGGASLAAVVGEIGDKFGYSVTVASGLDINSVTVRKTAVTGGIRECLASVVPDRFNFFIKGFQIVISEKGKPVATTFLTLDLSRGLKEYPEKAKKRKKKEEIIRYNISTVYTPGLDIGTVIKIPYDKETGYYIPEAIDGAKFFSFLIRKYSKEFDGSNFVASLECELISSE